jgi:hypothetical protein
MHDRRLFAADDDAFGDETLRDLPGERGPLPAESLTRVGEAER